MTRRSNEDIIESALQTAPRSMASIPRMGLRVTRWQQVCRGYRLDRFADPLLVAHLGGTRRIRYRDGRRWSRHGSSPGTVTYFPEDVDATRWLADGDLDVVTISIEKGSPMRSAIVAARPKLEVGVPDALTVALVQTISAALAVLDSNDVRSARYLESMSETLLLHFARGERVHADGGAEDATLSPVHRVAEYIDLHCGEPLRIEALAAEAGLSPAYFSELFKRTIGVSPHRYLLEARVRRAREALSLSDTGLAALALDLGFSSQSHLSDVFRRLVGVTPAEYRRSTAGRS